MYRISIWEDENVLEGAGGVVVRQCKCCPTTPPNCSLKVLNCKFHDAYILPLFFLNSCADSRLFIGGATSLPF